jgi:hypothetical protein
MIFSPLAAKGSMVRRSFPGWQHSSPMTDPLSSERPVDRPWEVATLAFLLFMVGVAGALSRKGLVPLLVITCLVLVGLVSGVDRKAIFPRTPAVTAGVAVLAWAALTNAWGMSLHIADLLQVTATIGMSVFAASMFAALPETSRLRLDRWLIAGSVVLVLFLIEEKLSGAKITTLLHPDPVLQIPTAFFPKIFVYAGGGTAVLAPTCVAVAALIYVHTRKVLLAVIYFVAAVIACAIMPMAAATLGAVLGGAAFVVAYYFRRFAFAAIFAGFAAYLIAAPSNLLVPADARRPDPDRADQRFRRRGYAQHPGPFRHLGACGEAEFTKAVLRTWLRRLTGSLRHQRETAGQHPRRHSAPSPQRSAAGVARIGSGRRLTGARLAVHGLARDAQA